MVSVNIAALVLRPAVGGTMMAHGWNHAFGGGKLPGTARWFESIGIRPGGAGHRGAGRSRRRRAAAGHLLAPAPPYFRIRPCC